MESTVLQHMVDDIIGGHQADAMDKFNQVLADKLSDALAGKKIEIASSLGQQPVEVETEVIETEDENVQ
jgi:hypothetical protein